MRGLSGTSKQFLSVVAIVNVAIMLFQGYYIIFLEQNGLTYSEMGLIFAASMIATAVFDFPTGNVADKYGRKFSLLIGITLFGVGITVYGMTSDIVWFLTAEVVAGLGMALVSGAPEAWLVDELNRIGRTEEVERVFSASFSISSISGIVAGVAASFLVGYALNLPFLISGLLSFAVVVISLVIMRENHGDADRDYLETMRQSLRHFMGERDLRLLAVAMVLSSTAIFAMLFIYQPYMVGKGMGIEWLGLFYSVIMVSTGLGSLMSSRMLRRVGRMQVIILAALLVSVGALGLMLVNGIVIIASLFLVIGLGHGIMMPVIMVTRNEMIPSDIRASVLSLMSTMTNTMTALAVVALGYLTDMAPIEWVMGTSAIISILSIPIFVLAMNGEPGSIESIIEADA